MEVDLNNINLEKNPELIHILAVIDTNYVKTRYPNPSTNPHRPTGISSNAVYMVNGVLPGVSSSEGTGNLNLKLRVGDKVSLMGTSLVDNSGDTALIYNVRHYTGDDIFNPFSTKTIVQAEAPSAAETPNVIPTSAESQVFYSFNSSARSSGSEVLATLFGLYTRSQNKKTLLGYFYWTWHASAA
ncbi:inclusion body family protein [Burkholderia sp. AU30280]|uniref:AidA/PixA family protein n=1 Tax=Burkholderia sp. AU30280 TaxID=2879628 RepID=UPI001CF1677F|nr:AidA/PixA family protein [Burkholderia sp. AU30280]MCA8271033.1 inclusion body family protein [Burkholderia sp. AU30280]